MVTHPSTNPARRALTSFMRQTPLTTMPCRKRVCVCVGVSQDDIRKIESERDHAEAALKSQISAEKRQMLGK